MHNKAPHRLKPKNNEDLNKQVKKLIDKGLIKESLSLCAVPIVLVLRRMGNGECALVLQILKIIIAKCRFHSPRMDDIMDRLSREKYFTKIYLKIRYHHIRIIEGDEWRTTYKKNKGLFEWLVMP